MTRTVVHAITPGDHYSPRTGSAIPTVVNGLASAADPADPQYQQAVLVDESTLRPHYPDPRAIEYVGAPPPTRREHLTESVLARAGLPRHAAERYYAPLAEVMDAEPPSIVVAHNSVTLIDLLRHSPHTLVLYAHNDIFKTIGKREAGRSLETCAAIVCVSAALAEQIRRRLPRRFSDRIHVVHNGIDVDQFHPRETSSDDLVPPRRRLRVVFIGRMIRDKGADVVLRAASRLRRDDIEFVIVGSSNFDRDAALTRFERSLRRIAATSGAFVTFEPFVERSGVVDLLRDSDVLVVPSRWQEPSTLTIAEGMACGLPVIASRVGGIPEVAGSAGILVPKEDPGAVAAAIARLADDDAYRARAGIAARRHAESLSWSRSWSRFRDVLETI